MTDAPRWPDWWQAADGKWYPPQQGNGPPPPPPAPAAAPAAAPESPKARKLRVRRERVRAQVQGLLEPGEQIEAMFVSQTGPSPRGVFSVGLSANLMRYWNVTVTDRNVVLTPVEAFGGKGSKRFLRRLPRAPIAVDEGPSKRMWFPATIAGERHWISQGERDAVMAANDLIGELAVAAPVGPAPSVPAPSAPATAPTPGWYGDPTTRHQVRFWDGRTWTASVADQGVQGVDPVKAA